MMEPNENEPGPRLLVDWGEMPRVGYQCRPEFVVLAPAYRDLRDPDIQVVIDRELDNSAETRVRLQSDGPGFWNFHVPFRMTTQGLDCRPGQYTVDVSITFHDVPAHLPRFFMSRIRLNVAGSQDGAAGVLEIDGDGQSVVNLQGFDLRQFSKVVLRGGQEGVINLAGSSTLPPIPGLTATTKPPTSFEYNLKVDQPKQLRLPQLRVLDRPRGYLESAGLMFEDGRRVILLSKPRISFGRSRDNDVVLRFFPRSEANDKHSLIISRQHYSAELTSDGIEIQDKSQAGMEINSNVVKGSYVISTAYVGESVRVELGVTGTVPEKFDLEMVLLGADRRHSHDDERYWDEIVCEVAGGKLNRVARLALETGVDAIRYDRRNSLAGEESYVQLFREVLVGGSSARCGVGLRDCGSQPQARIRHIDRTFWLEVLPNARPLTIDGVAVTPLSFVPLALGMEISFGGERVRVDRPLQQCLD